MNSDELKAGWKVLNERLAQHEIINKRIIKEMITQRTKSAYDQIYRSELGGLCLILALGLFVLPGNMFAGASFKRSSFIFLEMVLLFAFLFRSFLLYVLSRFDLKDMKVRELRRWVLTYKKFYGYNVTYGSGIGLGSIVVFMILENTYTSFYSVCMIAGMLILAIVYTLPRAKRHAQRIEEVEQGLAELKAFESADESIEKNIPGNVDKSIDIKAAGSIIESAAESATGSIIESAEGYVNESAAGSTNGSGGLKGPV